MGKKEIQSLIRVLQGQLDLAAEGVVIGTWEIRYEKDRSAFIFDKCEFDAYCEERPSIVSIDGVVMDRGGPLLRS